MASALRRVVKPAGRESANVVTTRLGGPLLLLKENDTGEASVAAAVTAYGPPAMALAVAVTEAVPEAIVTGPDGLQRRRGPARGRGEGHNAPIDGSPGFFGVTVTWSAVGNGRIGGRGLVVAGGDGQGEAGGLEGADVDGGADDPRHAALVGGQAVAVERRRPGQCCQHRWPGCRASRAMVWVGPP